MVIQPKMQEAAILLAMGKNSRSVADSVGVTPQTIAKWRNNELFDCLVNMLMWEQLQAARTHMQQLGGEAAETVLDVMKNGKSDSARLKAAELALHHAGLTDPDTKLFGWSVDPSKAKHAERFIYDHGVIDFEELYNKYLVEDIKC